MKTITTRDIEDAHFYYKMGADCGFEVFADLQFHWYLENGKTLAETAQELAELEFEENGDLVLPF